MLYSAEPEPSRWHLQRARVPSRGFMSEPATNPVTASHDGPALARWVRAADAATLILVVLAAVIAEWGGFRERIGTTRIALTSPWRMLLLAALVAGVRHWRVPAPGIHVDLPRRILRALRTPASRTAWGALIATRPIVLFVGYLAVVMIGYRAEEPPLRLSHNEIENLQVRWDMAWYFGIATEGYRVESRDPTDQQNIVFFPAFPMIVRVVARFLGGSTLSFVAAGTVVALVAFFWGLTYLFRFARDVLGEEDAARQTVWFLAAYPFALFFSAMYTESLYLVGAVGAFYHFRRREFRAAGAWGLLVGLTRPNGCFVSIPLGILAVAPWLPRWLNGGSEENIERAPERRTIRALVPALASAAMPGVGVLLYCAFMWRLTGNPLAWAEGHAAWGRQYVGLGALVAERYRWISESGFYVYASTLPGDLVNGLGALFVLVAAIPVARRLGLAYAVFILVNILPPMAAGGLLSVGRFSSVMFPAFIWFATAVPARHRTGWLASFMAFQAFNASLFYTWRELF